MVRLIPHLARKKTRFIRATYLTPQKAAESETEYATCDAYQRKVLYDGTNFFALFAYDVRATTPPPYGRPQYVASGDGKTWTTMTNLCLQSIHTRLLGCQPDIAFRPESNTIFGSPYLDSTSGIDCFSQTIIGQTLSRTIHWSISAGGAAGISLCQNLDTGYYVSYFRSGALWVIEALNTKFNSVSLDGYSTTDGGTQLLSYESASPFNMLLIVKKGDNTLHYSIVTPSFGSAPTIGSFTSMGITLASGFESFCATSEVQKAGDPERVHLVYIKATGELCYNKFENDALGDEVVLVASGASYPVIAVGKGGKLYVFCVKDGKIKLIMYPGNWHGEIEPFKKHTFNTPTYLSTNQNVQHGRVGLVWTEGTATPYEVWFAYLMD